MAKLRYVDRMARRFRDTEPLRAQGATDVTVEEMETTVADYYRKTVQEQQLSGDLALDTGDRALAGGLLQKVSEPGPVCGQAIREQAGPRAA